MSIDRRVTLVTVIVTAESSTSMACAINDATGLAYVSRSGRIRLTGDRALGCNQGSPEGTAPECRRLTSYDLAVTTEIIKLTRRPPVALVDTWSATEHVSSRTTQQHIVAVEPVATTR